MLNRLVLAVLALAVLLSTSVAAAAPTRCLFPGQTARAKLLTSSGPAPAACAMNTCRTIGFKTSKAWPCDADPTCITGGFSWQAWQVEAGPWAGLPACPAWTNTSTWQ